jgi:hypothetical protein
MLGDPLGSAQLLDLRPLESAGMAVVNIFQTGGDLQLRVVQPRGQRPVLPPQPLSFDQQSKTFFEIQLADVGLAALLFQRLGHALQTQRQEFVQGLVI